MKTNFCIEFLLSICVLAPHIYAEDDTIPGTTIFYVNGVFVEQAAAEKSRDAIKGLSLDKSIEPDDIDMPGKVRRVSYRIAYNQNEDAWPQLLQVFEQGLGNRTTKLWLWLANLEPAPDWFRSSMLGIASNILSAFQLNDADLDTHMDNYRATICGGDRVVMVSHSQGNFYANQAYLALPNVFLKFMGGAGSAPETLAKEVRKSFGNVQVASPVPEVASGGPYTTFFDDLIIAPLSLANIALLPNVFANGIGLPPEGDPLGHSFIKAYMRVSASRSRIESNLKEMAANLERPSPDNLCTFF